jgi:hypothetical protein
MKKVKVVDESVAYKGNKTAEFDPHRKWTVGHKCFTSAEPQFTLEQYSGDGDDVGDEGRFEGRKLRDLSRYFLNK